MKENVRRESITIINQRPSQLFGHHQQYIYTRSDGKLFTSSKAPAWHVHVLRMKACIKKDSNWVRLSTSQAHPTKAVQIGSTHPSLLLLLVRAHHVNVPIMCHRTNDPALYLDKVTSNEQFLRQNTHVDSDTTRI